MSSSDIQNIPSSAPWTIKSFLSAAEMSFQLGNCQTSYLSTRSVPMGFLALLTCEV